MVKWNRMKMPEINPPTYGQLICDKGGKNVQRKKDSPSMSVLGKLDSYVRKNGIRTVTNTMYKINWKWIKDLNVRMDTIKL